MDMAARNPRPLPGSFATWLDLSSADEALALLALVIAALGRKGFLVANAVRRLP